MKTLKKAFLLLMAVALFATVLMLPTAAEEVTVPDPLAWYSFEDNSDFGKDNMDAYHLDCNNGGGMPVYAAEGAVGNAISLDGDYVLASPIENDLAAALDNKSFTISYYAIRKDRIADYRRWETPLGVSTFRPMHAIDGGYKDLIHILFAPDFDYWTNIVEYPDYALTANLNMYTYSVEIGGGTTVVKYFFNGEYVNTVTLQYELAYLAEGYTFAIGSIANADLWYHNDEYGGCFTGIIDEVRVWNSVLTEEQVAKVFTTDNPDGTTKNYDTVFGLSFDIPDDLPEDDTSEETESGDDSEVTTNGDSETEEKPDVTTAPESGDSGDDEGGLSTTVIVIIVVAAVLVVAAVILGVVASKKKK